MNFGINPDATFDITFVNASKGEHKLSITDEMYEHDVPGVYVFYFKEYEVGRMNGRSPVIRIGSTNKGLAKRLKNYDGKRSVTTLTDDQEVRSVGWIMRNWYKKNGGTEAYEAYLMSYLWNARNQRRPVALAYYRLFDPEWYESDFMLRYLDIHQEIPPANLRLERIATRRDPFK